VVKVTDYCVLDLDINLLDHFLVFIFYPHDAMLARVIAIAMCPSVCPSVRHALVLCQNEES